MNFGTREPISCIWSSERETVRVQPFLQRLSSLPRLPPPRPQRQESSEVKLALTIEIDGAIGPATAKYVKEALADRGRTACRSRDPAAEHAGRPRHQHARDHRRHPRLACSGRRLRRSFRRPCGERRHLHPLCNPYRGHGARHKSRRRDAGRDRRPAAGAAGRRRSQQGQRGRQTEKDQTPPPRPEDTMSAKMTNDLVAFIRSLAELRGRNADWAEKAVREAASLSASAALQAHVIDLVARDVPELLQKIDGRTIDDGGRRAASGNQGIAGRNAEARLAHPASLGHHRSECRRHPDARRHLRSLLRILEPRGRRPWRDRHDLPAARALRTQHAADRLYRAWR